jgi:hypothetical protein
VNIDVANDLSGLLHPQINVDVRRDDIHYGQFHPSADSPCLNPQTKICDLWAEQPSQDYVHAFICLPHDISVPTDENLGECLICLVDQARDI